MDTPGLIAPTDAVRQAAIALATTAAAYDPLMELIGDARVVLVGEASHGTHEFYAERAVITQRLIAEKGFTAVAVEADWPHAYRVNRYVRGMGTDTTADEALAGFGQFPAWMWRNTVVRAFAEWLRGHNAQVPVTDLKAGFYGIDLYSLHESTRAVISYLDAVDPAAAQQARQRYSCFEPFADPQAYGRAASVNSAQACADAVVAQLQELQRRAGDYLGRDGDAAEDAYFDAEQNARLATNAEAYYRTLFQGHVSSWSLRDTHMADTLDALVAHLDRHGGRTKVVVWAHNSHLGDARATERHATGEVNLSQLVRERHGDAALLVGFSTYTGTVTAAADWGAAPYRKRVRPALASSYEALFHATHLPRFLLPLRSGGDASEVLRVPRLQRAIGVVYRPHTERMSHYFTVRLPDQFDVLLHIDETHAVEPLERTAGWEGGELPETYPSGM
jgi:erythromycin esterase-like protein